MLNTKPHTVTREVDGEAVTLVFYPDTGCLRFADARGLCHELRPPHSWLAISAAGRGVRRGAQSMTEGLSLLLNDFCTKRPRWLSGPERVSVVEPVFLPADEAAHGATHRTFHEASPGIDGEFAQLGMTAAA